MWLPRRSRMTHFLLSCAFLSHAKARRNSDVSTSCHNPLGMQSGKINATQITASSSLSDWMLPSAARLHNTRRIPQKSFGAWCASNTDKPQYLQIDLIRETNVTAVSTQGLDLVDVADGYWVTSYSLNYSCDGNTWTTYKHGGKKVTFSANRDSMTVVTRLLRVPVRARFIRVQPVNWNDYGQICLRVELYGCSTTRSYATCNSKEQPSLRTMLQTTQSKMVPNGPKATFPIYRSKAKTITVAGGQNISNCSNALGMESGEIGESQITASSTMSRWMRPSAARLSNDMNISRQIFGGWCAKKADLHQYLQIDLKANKRVTAIATQGMEFPSGNWVTRYTLGFSCKGSLWQQYKVDGRVVVFSGNDDEENVITNKLPVPVLARYLRIKPLAWNIQGSVCLRLELYGCTGLQECQAASPSSPARNLDPNDSELPKPDTTDLESDGSRAVNNDERDRHWVKATNKGTGSCSPTGHLAIWAFVAIVHAISMITIAR